MRDNSVTISKGIAIILMVLGHARCPELVNSYLTMIRMPLFFFMSGFCFKEKYLADKNTYLKRRVTGIYWPYIKWSLLFLLLHNIFFYLNIYNTDYGFNGNASVQYSAAEFLRHAKSIVTKMNGHERLLGGFWFLKSLFVGSLIFYFTRLYIKSFRISMPILLALLLFLSYTGWKLPYFSIGARETLGAFFLMTGHIYKTHNIKWHNNNFFIAAAIIMVGIGSFYWPTSMQTFKYTNVIPYAITAIIGTLTIFRIGVWLAKKQETMISRFLIYTGNHTFNVLTWHFLSMKLVSLIIILLYGLSIKQLAEFPVIESYANNGWWVLYFIVGVSVPVAGTYLYHSIGKNKKE